MKDAPPLPSAPRLRKLKSLAFALLAIGLVLDLWSKAAMEDMLGMDPDPQQRMAAQRIEVIPGFMAWEGTYNPGVTFGLAPNKTTLILTLTGLASLGLLAWLIGTRSGSRLLHIGLGLILAGALGNLYDRFHWSKVRDFILWYVGDFRWPNFNLADAFIVVGVGLVMWDSLFGWSAKRAKYEAEQRKATA